MPAFRKPGDNVPPVKKTAPSQKYEELRVIVDRIARDVAMKINAETAKVKSDMPYKAQWVLEELIKDLEQRV